MLFQCFHDKPHRPHARLFTIECFQFHHNWFHHVHKVGTSIAKPIFPYVGSNIFHLGEVLVLMAVTQHVDKSCPFSIDDRFLAWLGGPKPYKKKLDPKSILQALTMCIVLT